MIAQTVPTTRTPASYSRPQRNEFGSSLLVLLVICALLSLLKLWMIHGDEVVARDYPHDDPWYIHAASHWYWGAQYSEEAIMRLPAFPLWMAFAQQTGIPLRLCVELLQLTAAFSFAAVIRKARQPVALCVLVFAAIVFHPASFFVNNFVYVDIFYTPCLVLALSGLIFLLVTPEHPRRIWIALSSGLLWAVLWHTREENFLIPVYLALFGALAFLHARRDGLGGAALRRRLAILFLLPTLIVFAVATAVKLVNVARFGLYATTEWTAPGFVAANKALQRIKPSSTRRFLPVPLESRKRAYAVSPAFRELESSLEGKNSQPWKEQTKAWLGLEDEIGAGWLPWALRQAAQEAGHRETAGDADEFYQRIANEINAACKDGRLPSRMVFHPFVDPSLGSFSPYLWGSLQKILGLFTSTAELPKVKDETSQLRPEIADGFDFIGNRRSTLKKYGTAVVSGWVAAEMDTIQSVRVRDRYRGIIASNDEFSPRADVTKFLAAAGKPGSQGVGFVVRVPLAGPQKFTKDVYFKTGEGIEFSLAGSAVSIGRMLDLVDPATGRKAHCVVESLQTTTIHHSAEENLQSVIWRNYGRLVAFFSWVGVGALLVLILSWRHANWSAPIFAILLLVGTVIASRVAVFTLLDAAAYPADQPRYLFSAMCLYSAAILIVVWQALKAAISRLSGLPSFSRLEWLRWQKNYDVSPTHG